MKKYLVVAINCLSGVAVVQIWPYIFDIIIPRNETYIHRSIVLLSKYYVIQEKYFYFIVLHINATYIVAAFALVAVGTMMLSYIIYICGMFKIAR